MLAACEASSNDAGPGGTTTGGSGSTAMTITTQSASTATEPTSGTPTTDSTPTDASTTGTTSPSDSSSSDGGESSTGEDIIQLCGLEDLKAGAPNPIISGTEPMMIPPDIATILVDNCGCHYADMLDVGPPVADYSHLLPLRIETWEQWQGTYGLGMNVKNTMDTVLSRVQDAPLQFTMPHRSCNIGGGERMVPEQRQVLIDWILAGGPDGATWIP